MRTTTRRPYLLLVALLTGLAIIMAACGGGESASENSLDEPDPTTTSTAGTNTTAAPSGPEDGPQSGSDDDTESQPTTTTTTEATTTTQPSAAGPSETILAIRDRGTLRVGITSEQLPFRTFDGSGFEIALVEAIASTLEPGTTVEIIESTSSDRFNRLAVGDYDLLVGSVHTLSRESEAQFSQPYLLNGLVAVVASDSGLTTINDLTGATVALPDGRIEGSQMEETLANAGISFVSAPIQNSAQGEAGVLDGSYAAFAASWGEAALIRSRDARLAIVPAMIATSPFALATSNNDDTFAVEINGALGELIDDGTWLSLFTEWFGGPPEWSIEEMQSAQPS